MNFQEVSRISLNTKEIEEVKPQTDKALAIDYGVSNFATIVIENQPVSYIIDG